MASLADRRDAGLTRGIGTFALAAATVNVVVGGGIFSLPAQMMQAAGPYALVAYMVCAVAMAGVVLCFAEAGSRVPTSGGTYGYVEEAFGPLAGFVAGVLLWLGCVLGCGGIAAAFADALARLVPDEAGMVRVLAILLVIGLFTAVNLLGVRPASRLVAAIASIKLIPLLLFVAVGLLFVHPGLLAQGPRPDAAGVGRAVILSLFAFQGMETSLSASGEVADPARTLPRALLAAMAFVTLLYVGIQIAAQGLLGAALGASHDPLADALGSVAAPLGTLMLAAAAVSRGGWIGSDLLGAPRVLFAFARDGFLPRGLGRVSARGVPANAILAHAAIAALLAVTGTFEQLAVLSVLSTCVLYIAGCAAAWRLRRRDVALAGAPLRLPVLGLWVAIGSVSMAATILLARPAEIAGLVAAIAAAVLLFAITARRRGARA